MIKCEFCGKETYNKASNQPMCKEHITEAKEKRDEHNEKIKKKVGLQSYLSTKVMERYVPNNPLADMQRTTAGYQLNKMYEELEVKPVDHRAIARAIHNKAIKNRRY